jgi:hypothetical protein
MNEDTKTNNQLAIISSDSDDFGDTDADQRLVQGSIVKFNDNVWSAKDGTDISSKTPLLALSTKTALQRWHQQMPVETIVKRGNEELPDVDELNEQIPESEWEKGIDGAPRPPWVKNRIVYLLDPKDASLFTFISGTVGARIAVDRLQDRVRWMRGLRGTRVVPLVTLGAKTMKTKFGQKMRPEFKIIDWRDLGGVQTTTPAIEHIGKSVEPPSLKEELNDEIPWLGD